MGIVEDFLKEKVTLSELELPKMPKFEEPSNAELERRERLRIAQEQYERARKDSEDLNQRSKNFRTEEYAPMQRAVNENLVRSAQNLSRVYRFDYSSPNKEETAQLNKEAQDFYTGKLKFDDANKMFVSSDGKNADLLSQYQNADKDGRFVNAIENVKNTFADFGTNVYNAFAKDETPEQRQERFERQQQSNRKDYLTKEQIALERDRQLGFNTNLLDNQENYNMVANVVPQALAGIGAVAVTGLTGGLAAPAIAAGATALYGGGQAVFEGQQTRYDSVKQAQEYDKALKNGTLEQYLSRFAKGDQDKIKLNYEAVKKENFGDIQNLSRDTSTADDFKVGVGSAGIEALSTLIPTGKFLGAGKSAISNFVKKGTVEAIEEGVAEGSQNYLMQNVAKFGNVDMEQVKENSAAGALVGFGFGGVLGSLGRIKEINQDNQGQDNQGQDNLKKNYSNDNDLLNTAIGFANLLSENPVNQKHSNTLINDIDDEGYRTTLTSRASDLGLSIEGKTPRNLSMEILAKSGNLNQDGTLNLATIGNNFNKLQEYATAKGLNEEQRKELKNDYIQEISKKEPVLTDVQIDEILNNVANAYGTAIEKVEQSGVETSNTADFDDFLGTEEKTTSKKEAGKLKEVKTNFESQMPFLKQELEKPENRKRSIVAGKIEDIVSKIEKEVENANNVFSDNVSKYKEKNATYKKVETVKNLVGRIINPNNQKTELDQSTINKIKKAIPKNAEALFGSSEQSEKNDLIARNIGISEAGKKDLKDIKEALIKALKETKSNLSKEIYSLETARNEKLATVNNNFNNADSNINTELEKHLESVEKSFVSKKKFLETDNAISSLKKNIDKNKGVIAFIEDFKKDGKKKNDQYFNDYKERLEKNIKALNLQVSEYVNKKDKAKKQAGGTVGVDKNFESLRQKLLSANEQLVFFNEAKRQLNTTKTEKGVRYQYTIDVINDVIKENDAEITKLEEKKQEDLSDEKKAFLEKEQANFLKIKNSLIEQNKKDLEKIKEDFLKEKEIIETNSNKSEELQIDLLKDIDKNLQVIEGAESTNLRNLIKDIPQEVYNENSIDLKKISSKSDAFLNREGKLIDELRKDVEQQGLENISYNEEATSIKAKLTGLAEELKIPINEDGTINFDLAKPLSLNEEVQKTADYLYSLGLFNERILVKTKQELLDALKNSSVIKDAKQGVDSIHSIELMVEEFLDKTSKDTIIFNQSLKELQIGRSFEKHRAYYNVGEKNDRIDEATFNEITSINGNVSKAFQNVLNSLKKGLGDNLKEKGSKSAGFIHLKNLEALFGKNKDFLGEVGIRFDSSMSENVNGFFDPLLNEIVLNPKNTDNGVIIHEVLHAISHNKLNTHKDFIKFHERVLAQYQKTEPATAKKIITPEEFLSYMFQNKSFFNDVVGIKGFKKLFEIKGDSIGNNNLFKKLSGKKIEATGREGNERQFDIVDDGIEKTFDYARGFVNGSYNVIKSTDVAQRSSEIGWLKKLISKSKKYANNFTYFVNKEWQDISYDIKQGLGESSDKITEFSLRQQSLKNLIENTVASINKDLNSHLNAVGVHDKKVSAVTFMANFENGVKKLPDEANNRVNAYIAQYCVLSRLITDKALVDNGIIVNGKVVDKDAFLSHGRGNNQVTIGKLLSSISNLEKSLIRRNLLETTNQYIANSFIAGKHQFDVKDTKFFNLKSDRAFKETMNAKVFAKQDTADIDVLNNPNSPYALLSLTSASVSDIYVPLHAKQNTYEKDVFTNTSRGAGTTDVSEYIYDDFDPFFQEVYNETGYISDAQFQAFQNVLIRSRKNVEEDKKNDLTLYLYSIADTLKPISLNAKGNKRVKVFTPLTTEEELANAKNKVTASILNENGEKVTLGIDFAVSSVKKNYLLSLNVPQINSDNFVFRGLNQINSLRKSFVTRSPTFIVNNLFNNISESKIAMVNLVNRLPKEVNADTRMKLKDWGGTLTPFFSQYNEMINFMDALKYLSSKDNRGGLNERRLKAFEMLDEMHEVGAIPATNQSVYTDGNEEISFSLDKFDNGFWNGVGSFSKNSVFSENDKKSIKQNFEQLIESIQDLAGGVDKIRHASEIVSAMSVYRILNQQQNSIPSQIKSGIITNLFPVQSWGSMFYSRPELKGWTWFINPALKGARENYRLFYNALIKKESTAQKKAVVKMVKWAIMQQIFSIAMISMNADDEEKDQELSNFYDGAKDFDGKTLISMGNGFELKVPIGHGGTNIVDKFVRSSFGHFLKKIDDIPDDLQLTPSFTAKAISIISSAMTPYKPREKGGEIEWGEALEQVITPEYIKPFVNPRRGIDAFGNQIALRKDEETSTYAYANELKTPENYKAMAIFMYENLGIDLSPTVYKLTIDSLFSAYPLSVARDLTFGDDSEVRAMKSKTEDVKSTFLSAVGLSSYYSMKGIGDITLQNANLVIDKFKSENASNEKAMEENPDMALLDEKIHKYESESKSISKDLKKAMKDGTLETNKATIIQRISDLELMKAGLFDKDY